jgi:GT2 family glycosyltransferase
VKIVAVVVNWNGGAQNLRCLESLLAEPAITSVLFVDNASSDGSRELVARRCPRVEVLDSGANLGYGGGNNLGFQRALELGADAVFVLNNDVTLAPGATGLLARELERDPRVGAVGPRVVFRDRPGVVWAAGGELTWRQNLSTLRGFGERDRVELAGDVDVDYVPGCALLVRRELIERLGGFDERYFAYTEDVDLGVRAARAGFRSRCVGAALAYHEPSSSTGGGYNPRRKYMMGVNSVWFLRQYAGPREKLKFVVYDVLTLPLALADGFLRGQAKAVLAKGLGIRDGLRGKRVTAETVRSGRRWLW